MNKSEKSEKNEKIVNNGWGAFQNLRTENQNLKKEIIAQNENNYGERIIIDKYNNFKNINSRVNPFRYPDSIKNDILEKEYNMDVFKKEEKKEVKKEVLLNKEEEKEENEYEICEKLIKKKQEQINELNKQKLNYKTELDIKIKLLENEYNLNILNHNNKIVKIQQHINNLQKIIETNNETDDNTSIISENSTKVPSISENILIELEENEDNEENEEIKQNKINKNRPESIKGCFNTNTIIRHKKSGFEEYCIYIVNEGCLLKCDKFGNYDKNSIRYSKLNQFTTDNYIKNSPNRSKRNNAYKETEYLCKISNDFLPLIDLKKGIIYN
jgi:hypothetical protein